MKKWLNHIIVQQWSQFSQYGQREFGENLYQKIYFRNVLPFFKVQVFCSLAGHLISIPWLSLSTHICQTPCYVLWKLKTEMKHHFYSWKAHSLTKSNTICFSLGFLEVEAKMRLDVQEIYWMTGLGSLTFLQVLWGHTLTALVPDHLSKGVSIVDNHGNERQLFLPEHRTAAYCPML